MICIRLTFHRDASRSGRAVSELDIPSIYSPGFDVTRKMILSRGNVLELHDHGRVRVCQPPSMRPVLVRAAMELTITNFVDEWRIS